MKRNEPLAFSYLKNRRKGKGCSFDLERRGRGRIYPRGRGTNGSGNPGDIKGLPCKNGGGGGEGGGRKRNGNDNCAKLRVSTLAER